jgi:hypothetical protein
MKNLTFTGIVRDDENKPLQDAHITVYDEIDFIEMKHEGKALGAITNAKGQFSLTIPDIYVPGYMLKISHVAHPVKLIPLKSYTSGSLIKMDQVHELEEVEVIATRPKKAQKSDNSTVWIVLLIVVLIGILLYVLSNMNNGKGTAFAHAR